MQLFGKYKMYNITSVRKNNFARCYVSVCNQASHIKERICADRNFNLAID
jgi:hypothetical protein